MTPRCSSSSKKGHRYSVCSVLQCVAVCCSVLQCVSVYTSDDATLQLQLKQDHRYSVLQRVAACCSVLQCVAMCCSVLQCVAVYTSDDATLQLPIKDHRYKVLQCGIVCCSELQRVAVHTSGDATFQLLLKKGHGYSMLQRGCRVLQRVSVRCSVLQCILVMTPRFNSNSNKIAVTSCCSVLQHVAAYCSVLQCIPVMTPRFNSNSNRITEKFSLQHPNASSFRTIRTARVCAVRTRRT